MAEGRLRYQPGLDGLRALGLVAMLAFHDGRLNGGFLGLSTFFTLSGFLITGLLLSEYGSAQTVKLGRFFARRARRLLPAAFLGLLLAAVVTAALHDGQASLNFRFDALSALAEVTNWRMIASGRSYANLLITPSPLLHYWSLAVEEQFYFVLAPLVAGCLWLTRGRKSVLAIVLATLAAASFIDGWFVVNQGIDRAYYGTDTRALEFLIGALLAVVMSGRVLNRMQSKVIAGVGPVVLILLAWATVVSHVTDISLFRGFLLIFAFGNAIVVLAACEPGPVKWLCSLAPLRLLGQISYGVYIYHWPIFIYLSHARTGMGPLALTTARMSVTLLLAILSYHLIEQPIRQRRRLTGATRWIVVPAAALVVVSALIVGAIAAPLDATFAPAVSAASVLKSTQQELASPATAPVADRQKAGAPRELKRILIVGDSLALTLGRGVERWGEKHGVTVLNDGIIGCPLLNGVTVRGYWGITKRSEDPCQTRRTWPKFLKEFKPDLVIALYGAWDVYDSSLDGGKTWMSPGQPAFAAYYAPKVADAARRLQATGSRLLWLTPPCFGANIKDGVDPNGVWWDPARVEVLREIDHQVGAHNGMVVSDAIHNPGCPVNRDLRPDGVHFSDAGADATMTFLGPILERVATKP